MSIFWIFIRILTTVFRLCPKLEKYPRIRCLQYPSRRRPRYLLFLSLTSSFSFLLLVHQVTSRSSTTSKDSSKADLISLPKLMLDPNDQLSNTVYAKRLKSILQLKKGKMGKSLPDSGANDSQEYETDCCDDDFHQVPVKSKEIISSKEESPIDTDDKLNIKKKINKSKNNKDLNKKKKVQLKNKIKKPRSKNDENNTPTWDSVTTSATPKVWEAPSYTPKVWDSPSATPVVWESPKDIISKSTLHGGSTSSKGDMDSPIRHLSSMRVNKRYFAQKIDFRYVFC